MSELVASLLLCALVGQLVDRALFGDPSCGSIERIGRALTFGFGTVGTVSIVLDGVGLGVSRATLGGALGVLVLVLAVPAWRRTQRPDPAEARGDASPAGAVPVQVWAWVGLLLLAGVGLGLAVHSGWVRPTFQFDALTRWMFKTKVLFHEQTLIGSEISTNSAYGYTHQRYPPLVSHVALLPGLISGRFDDRIASAIYPWYAVALAGVVYGALARRAGFLTGALAACWVGNLPLISFVVDRPPGAGAYAAMADIPLSLFMTATALAAADAIDGRRARAHLEAGLLLGFVTLTKNEGLAFVVAVGLGVLVAAPRARVRRALGITGLAALVFLVVWWRVAQALPAEDENYLAQLGLSAFTENVHRLGLILPELGKEFLNFRSWDLTWPAVVVLLVLGGWRIGQPVPRMLLVVFVIQLASYVFAYVITAWESPSALAYVREGYFEDVLVQLMLLTLGRLVLHIAPLAVCLALIVSPLQVRRSG